MDTQNNNDVTDRNLVDYRTGERIRKATAAEAAESDHEVEIGHAEGTIMVDGVCCYVEL